MTPLVSVVIPTFNRGSFVRWAIQSALSQTHSAVEVIIVDDGSTDETEEVILAIKDPRVRYFRTGNQGNYCARNIGLEKAEGEFIAFLDSDDQFLPEKIAKQLEQFQKNPTLGLCCTNAHIKHLGNPYRVFEDVVHSFSEDFDTKSGFIERAIESNFIVTSTVMIRRECVRTLGVFNTAFQNAMDYEFFLRIILNYPAVYLKDKLVERLLHPASISRNRINTYKAEIYIFSESAKRLEQEKMFAADHKDLIQKAWRKSMYSLGLEYLVHYEFENAHRCFTESGYEKRYMFKKIAIAVSKYQLSLLVPLIQLYRHLKQYQSSHRNPASAVKKSSH